VSFFTYLEVDANGRFGEVTKDNTTDLNEAGKMDASLYSPFIELLYPDCDDCLHQPRDAESPKPQESRGEREWDRREGFCLYLNTYVHHFLVKRTSKK
jgi:hypothetical protein